MRIWAKIIKDHKIHSDVVQEFSLARPSDIYGWTQIISSFCNLLDIERPVILEKHIRDLTQFSITFFRKTDFMDYFPFDRFEIEVFPEKKENESPSFTDSYYI